MPSLDFSITIRAIMSACVLLTIAAVARAEDKPLTPEQIEFFESKIRPVLVTHCYECHSAKSQPLQGSLRLDTEQALRKGGETGASLDLEKPADSLLLQALQYDGPEMPPTGKLPDPILADFKKWVEMGAPDPRIETESSATSPLIQNTVRAKSHWAFQPVHPPAMPEVKAKDWSNTPIDALILAKLERKSLTPSPVAERRTLLRRWMTDLVGLPPTLAEIENFEQDSTPDAAERVVDKLLSSPRYGERWGRHWLDVARYADTKDGVLMYGDDRIRPYAYTYRDYVIRAMNEDIPFGQFVEDQLAADQIEPAVEPWRLGAMGFLTLGRMFDNNVPDQIDDKIDTVTRGFLGLTTACARCHDHKYDPISQADYYSLYGVFASSEAPLVAPRTDPTSTTPEGKQFDDQLEAKRAEINKFRDDQYALLMEESRRRTPDYLSLVMTTKADINETGIFFLSLRPEDLRPPITFRWRRFIEDRIKASDTFFSSLHDLMAIPDDKFAEESPSVIKRWLEHPRGTAAGEINPRLADALTAASPKTRADAARLFGEVIQKAFEDAKNAPPTAAGVSNGATAESLALAQARDQLASILNGPESPASYPRARTQYLMSREPKDQFGGKINELDKMAVQSPHAPARAMILQDSEQLYDPKIFVRGNPSVPGAPVPRQFLAVLSPADRQPFSQGSGRLDLAKAINNPANPVTRRVIVNRLWMHHFGEPLIDSPSDVGLRTASPIHLDVVDTLAKELIDHDDSLKSLHRLIVTSSMYQQQSIDRTDCRPVDTDNKLYWRVHRKRLDLETMRDSMLSVSGDLDDTMFGRPVDIVTKPDVRRRTVYGLVDRQSLPGFYRAFDFASPDQSAERRPHTTVPQQALYSLNSPFIHEQAKCLTAKPEFATSADIPAKVRTLYRLTFGRDPSKVELTDAESFVAAADTTASALTPWQQLAQVLLMSNEFLFVD